MASFELSSTPATDPALLLRYRDRQYAADMMAVAILKLNLFTWIHEQEQVSRDLIAEHFKLASRALDVLITLCRAGGWITSGDNDLLRLTEQAKEFLVDSSEYFLGPYYQPIADSPIATGCLQVLKEDRPANWQAKDDSNDWHESMMDEEFAKGFTALMNCRGVAMGQSLAAAVEPWIGNVKSILDVGGGSGIYSATLLAKHPHLVATVFEQQPVDRITQSEIELHGLQSRIEVQTGNMFSDPWPKTDCVLLSNVLHDWDFPAIRQIIQKCSESVSVGGKVIVHEAFLNDDKDGPLPVAEYSVLLVNITQGRCYSPAEYGEIFEEFGFKCDAYQDTIADRGFFVAIKQ
ncbi:methyltransferase domain-containing protein [Stieleria sp. JC731]|uniref:methyltransferase n=1 Tax=Pirellulaceae TaxID=2691357 RepID=UPI001E5B61A0|nr:methyltransferase [Stieleria sp. JC731]MCC9603467.1 methyltransferase domain-containing protein [Stieleria sp. JC731]